MKTMFLSVLVILMFVIFCNLVESRTEIASIGEVTDVAIKQALQRVPVMESRQEQSQTVIGIAATYVAVDYAKWVNRKWEKTKAAERQRVKDMRYTAKYSAPYYRTIRPVVYPHARLTLEIETNVTYRIRFHRRSGWQRFFDKFR